MNSESRRILLAAACALAFSLSGSTCLCASERTGDLNAVDHIIVIYQENWSFDGLYGFFPNAEGIRNATAISTNQIDRVTGKPIANMTNGPYNRVTTNPFPIQVPPEPLNDGAPPTPDTNFLSDPNDVHSRCLVSNTLVPYNLSNYISPTSTTGDLWHRYWQEQFQINHGKNNMFATWGDNPGLVMSYYDAKDMPEGKLAQQYTMCDHFFHSAFGGSFINHQFLIAAQPPVYPNAANVVPNIITLLDTNGVLATDSSNHIIKDKWITPIGGVVFADKSRTFDKNYAVNTGISINLANATITPKNKSSFLPSQNDSDPSDPERPYIPTIGDRMDAAGVSWKWYSGGWNQALTNSASNPGNSGTQTGDASFNEDFQWHHQPFAYYDHYAPWTKGFRNPRSEEHLQDETNFFTDVANHTLPLVCFIKAYGTNNEHPGYASLMAGQLHVSNLVAAVQSKPELWAHSLIIITYDEHGGRWDHVAPPRRDIWGPGVRVPAIIISPLARTNYVDPTQYETLSILKTIEQRFGLQPLTPADAGANSLAHTLDPNLVSRQKPN